MFMHTHSMAARLSKFKVGELALKSALELERARAGISYDRSQLTELAEALRVSAGQNDEKGKMAFMRPGYFEPFERVYRSSLDADPKSIEDIQKFVIKTIEDIDAVAQDEVSLETMSKLVDFCLELNREFVRRQPTENRVGRRQRSVAVEAFVR
jgi:hypothetical protein